MKLKKVNKSFNCVNFVTTINHNALFTTYYTSSEKISYSSRSHSPKYKLGYRTVYSIYKNADMGFFLENFTDIIVV